MALTCGFFNSVDGDRKYDATQFASLFDGVITDGVVAAVGEFFATTPGGGMVVNVGSGRAWFNRTWTYSDAKIPLTLDASDLLYDRIDAVVLEIDTSIAIRDNSIKVVKGTPAQTPQKPTLTNSGDIHQYALAYVRVKASTSEIGSGDITINVGQEDCPFVTSIVDTPDLEVLFAQWDAQFTEWFENVQAQLEGDVAANLQRQIDLKANKTDLGDFETPAKKLGLTGDLSVGASLGVLAKVGDLHVWKRTKTIGEEIPAGYKKEPVTNPYGFSLNVYQKVTEYEYGTVSVSDDGTVNLISEGRVGVSTSGNGLTKALGKFFKAVSATTNSFAYFAKDVIYFMPSDCEFSYTTISGYNIWTVDKTEKVIGIPAVHPGIYIDHPVSTNPNAYQEGSDAKPAGYTLGEIQSGQYALNNQSSDPMRFYYADDVIVDEDGNVSIGSTNKKTKELFGGASATEFLGKFIQAYETGGYQWFSDFEKDVVYFIPSDAEISNVLGPEIYATYINKRQPVTGYPATPAGTIIEYLGKLGDKARIVTGSYVGTGTYGNSNPTKVKISPSPKFAIISPADLQNHGRYPAFIVWCFGSTSASSVMTNREKSEAISVNYSDGYFSWSGTSPIYQLNESGTSYVYTFLT